MAVRTPLRWPQILWRTLAKIDEDDCLGLAAQLAFYFFLSLFPALLFLVALVGYLPLEDTLARMLTTLGSVAPGAVVSLLRTQLEEITQGTHVGLLTLGIAGAIWSSSAAMLSLINALNHAYEVEERRSWWKQRLVAILLTVAAAVFIVLSLVLVLAGPGVAAWVAGWFGLTPVFARAWAVARWPLMLGLVVFGVDLVYRFGPNRRGRGAWVTPGALVATGLWILSSFAFKFYVANLAQFNATYGAIGGVVVVLLWCYVSGLAILVGAELNGVIEQAPPPSSTNPADRRT